jgi:hypothetical protein
MSAQVAIVSVTLEPGLHANRHPEAHCPARHACRHHGRELGPGRARDEETFAAGFALLRYARLNLGCRDYTQSVRIVGVRLDGMERDDDSRVAHDLPLEGCSISDS